MNILSTVDARVSSLLQNPYVMAVLKLTLTLYAAQLAPRLPDTVSLYLQNTFVKLLALFLIVYIGNRDIQLAILLAVIYVLGSNLLSGRQLLESFSQAPFLGHNTPRGNLLEPNTMIHPGCLNLTLDQLVAAFDGDQAKLLKNVQQTYFDLMQKFPPNTSSRTKLEKMAFAVGLPYNMSLDRGDEVAPYIATILMYGGFTLSDLCTQPA